MLHDLDGEMYCDKINFKSLVLDKRFYDCRFLRNNFFEDEYAPELVDKNKLRTKKQPFSSFTKICSKNTRNPEVLKCIIHSIYDSDLGYKKLTAFDYDLITTDPCTHISFTFDEQNLVQITDYVDLTYTVSSRLKRSISSEILHNNKSNHNMNEALIVTIIFFCMLFGVVFSFFRKKSPSMKLKLSIVLVFVCLIKLIALYI